MTVTRTIRPDGIVEYRLYNGNAHRTNGPAIIFSDGSEIWCNNGKIHREDGPAIVWHDGSREWWIDGFKQSSRNF